MKILMDGEDISRAINRIAHEIIEKNKGAQNIVFIGILEGGVPLAKRIAQVIEKTEGIKVPIGGVDVSLHRDDLRVRGKSIKIKKSSVTFSIEKKIVVLMDDVLFHGRTTRAALDSLNDYGRPEKIELAVLVDRGRRELPIQPDYFGKKIQAMPDEEVIVELTENSMNDKVILDRKQL